MKKFTLLLLMITLVSSASWAQLSIGAASTDYTITFDATVTNVINSQYQGAGFQPSPTAGQLNSDAWAATGMSDGDLSFGGTATSGDYARGISTGGEGTGGFWAFDIGSGDYIFGIQPGGSDWTPGTVTLKITNNTGSTITSLEIDYDIEVYNDQARANALNFSHSADDVTYTSVAALDFTTPEVADGSPSWQTTNRTTTITGLSIADGNNYYIRWEGHDVSGGGSRDEYGFHNIVVNASTGAANSADSDIVKKSGWSEPTNIDYLQYSATSTLTTTNSIEVGEFTIRDGGAAGSDSDSEPTGLISVTFSISNFDNIQALALFDGTTNVSEVTSVTASTTFSGISGLSAADDATKDFSVNATFKTNITDNDNLKFTIISASADASGSTFAAGDAGGAETDDTGDNNKLVVSADRLAITTPSTVLINTDFTVDVEATDINGSRDLDEVSSMTLAKATGTGTLSSVTGLTQSLAAGFYEWTDVQYDMAEDFTIDAQSATLTTATSGTITALASSNTDLIISEVTDPSDTYQNKFVEIYNAGTSLVDFSAITWYLSRQANGGNWGNILLTGTVSVGGTYVIAYNQSNFTTAYGFEADQYSGTVSGNGDDGYYLYYNGDQSTGTLIDAYGVIDLDGSGEPWEYLNTKAVRLHSVITPNTTWTASEWDIPGSAITDDMTPAEHKEDVTWAGTTDTDWNTKGNNWSGTYGYIPDASFNVTISGGANDAVISDESACFDITLSSSGKLNVSPTKSMTIYGNLTNSTTAPSRDGSNFVIDSDATGNGSVIVEGTVTGDATVERYIEGFGDPANVDDGWHFISSPVGTIPIAGSDFVPTSGVDDFYAWSESEADTPWKNYFGGSGPTQFTQTEGFLVAYQNTSTKEIVGTLTAASNFPIGPLSKGNQNGWHLRGNPYPSAITWNEPTDDWSLTTEIGGVAKIWDEAAVNYADIGAGFPIPSTNGFFVQATVDGANFNIPASARVHSDQDNYKAGEVGEMGETLVLTVTNDVNTYYDINRVGFRVDATEAWDVKFDSHKLFGRSSAPQLWTVTNDDIFSWNNLPYQAEAYQVPLHFRAGVNATYQISAEGVQSFYESSEIYLEDLFAEKLINLQEQPMYSFAATTEDAENRFILHFHGITSVDESPVAKNALIYSNDKTVYIKFNQLPKSNTRVEVFNTLGQQVAAGDMAPATLMQLRLDEKPGIYIVRLRTENGLITQKVMIK